MDLWEYYDYHINWFNNRIEEQLEYLSKLYEKRKGIIFYRAAFSEEFDNRTLKSIDKLFSRLENKIKCEEVAFKLLKDNLEFVEEKRNEDLF